MKSIKVLGTGSYAPSLVLSNDDLSQLVDTNDEWISTRTGIKNRHITQGETAWEMGLNSAKQALKNANLQGSDIQAIIGTTISGDYYYPSLACIISKGIGAKNPIALDVACACSGFVYAVDMARRYLQDDDVQNVLIVASEVLSKQTDFTDRSTCVLFGDASAAMIVTKADGLFSSVLKSENEGMETLFAKTHDIKNPWVNKDTKQSELFEYRQDPFVYMAGNSVYKFAIKAIPEAVVEACEKAGISPEEIDWLVPHQANIRIIKTAAKALNISMDKVLHNIEEYGNTSSASIPLCFDENFMSGKIKKGDKVCFVGFGGGLTYGACVFEIV